jgi:polar amino acid transport system substrate-binding protein
MKHFNRRYFFLPVLLIMVFLSSGALQAEEITISMAYLPGILETPDNGPFVDLIKAIDNAYEGTIKRGVFPFPRSIENVVSGKADFHLPMIRNTLIDESSLPYAYSTSKMGNVVFVIYSHKDNPITVEKINAAKSQKPFPYKIETSGGFESYFDFTVSAASGVDSALKKIDRKRIDGFIFAQEECDHVTKQLKLKNIHRELYNKFDDVFIIPKGAAGKRVDEILTTCLEKMKSDGSMQMLHSKVHLDYQQWQPHQMGW